MTDCRDLEAETDNLAASLDPGSYILVCTVPHPYVRNQMVAALTIQTPDQSG